MKRISRLLIVGMIFCSGACLLQAKPYLEFDGKRYYQAWSGSPSDTSEVVEYLPKGQSLEHWKQMLSVRLFKDLKNPDSYLRDLAAHVEKSNPAAKAVLYQDQHMIDFMVFSEDGRMAELNFMKVRYEQGHGLYVEQFAQRYDNLNEKSEDEMRQLGGTVRDFRNRIAPLFYRYDFVENR